MILYIEFDQILNAKCIITFSIAKLIKITKILCFPLNFNLSFLKSV